MSLMSEQVKELRILANLAEDAKFPADIAYSINNAADTIEELSAKLASANMERSTAYYNNGWIPCSERLPKEPFACLVTIMDCEPMTQTDFENVLPYHVGYDGQRWNDADGDAIPFEVIAWMPRPEPYQPEVE